MREKSGEVENHLHNNKREDKVSGCDNVLNVMKHIEYENTKRQTIYREEFMFKYTFIM